jgi:hypothetical protein
MSWLSGYRRLSPRYERHPRNYLAFLGLAAALCYCKGSTGCGPRGRRGDFVDEVGGPSEA